MYIIHVHYLILDDCDFGVTVTVNVIVGVCDHDHDLDHACNCKIFCLRCNKKYYKDVHVNFEQEIKNYTEHSHTVFTMAFI